MNIETETGGSVSLVLVVLLSLSIGCRDTGDSSIDAVVTGNSMAPAFWGEHVRATCDQCGCSFRVGVHDETLPERLVCPNCGFRSIESASAKLQSAQRVRVEQFGKPESEAGLDRWDVVAVRASESRPAMIKRVIGLPGESIQFVGGDVFANGMLVRKSLDVARAMRVPVFDSRFSSANVLRRLQSLDKAEGWNVVDGLWSCLPSSKSNGTQWLAYEQWRCVASGRPLDHVVAVEDWYATNVNLNRNLNTMRDVWAKFDLRVADDCRLDLAVNLGSAFHTFEIDFGAGHVMSGGRRVPFGPRALKSQFGNRSANRSDAKLGTGGDQQAVCVEVCAFDQRLVLQIDGQAVETIELPSFDGFSDVLSPVRIGGRSKSLVIERFQLWRDLYFSDVSTLSDSDAARRLIAGPDEYLLVGDNVPVSIDSRHWSVPGVPADEILGVVQPEK